MIPELHCKRFQRWNSFTNVLTNDTLDEIAPVVADQIMNTTLFRGALSGTNVVVAAGTSQTPRFGIPNH
jgi:hypothetical protein